MVLVKWSRLGCYVSGLGIVSSVVLASSVQWSWSSTYPGSKRDMRPWNEEIIGELVVRVHEWPSQARAGEEELVGELVVQVHVWPSQARAVGGGRMP